MARPHNASTLRNRNRVTTKTRLRIAIGDVQVDEHIPDEGDKDAHNYGLDADDSKVRPCPRCSPVPPELASPTRLDDPWNAYITPGITHFPNIIGAPAIAERNEGGPADIYSHTRVRHRRRL